MVEREFQNLCREFLKIYVKNWPQRGVTAQIARKAGVDDRKLRHFIAGKSNAEDIVTAVGTWIIGHKPASLSNDLRSIRHRVYQKDIQKRGERKHDHFFDHLIAQGILQDESECEDVRKTLAQTYISYRGSNNPGMIVKTYLKIRPRSRSRIVPEFDNYMEFSQGPDRNGEKIAHGQILKLEDHIVMIGFTRLSDDKKNWSGLKIVLLKDVVNSRQAVQAFFMTRAYDVGHGVVYEEGRAFLFPTEIKLKSGIENLGEMPVQDAKNEISEICQREGYEHLDVQQLCKSDEQGNMILGSTLRFAI